MINVILWVAGVVLMAAGYRRMRIPWSRYQALKETERRLTVDPHSPPKFRVYGALRNLPAFAEAFHCVAGTPMRPAKSCTVW